MLPWNTTIVRCSKCPNEDVPQSYRTERYLPIGWFIEAGPIDSGLFYYCCPAHPNDWSMPSVDDPEWRKGNT